MLWPLRSQYSYLNLPDVQIAKVLIFENEKAFIDLIEKCRADIAFLKFAKTL